MIHHALMCMLDNKELATNPKTLRVNMNPTEAKIREIYQYNITALDNLIVFCQQKGIKALRTSSSLFPLLSHPAYQAVCERVIKELLGSYKFNDYMGEMYLSSHPDQFILLSSLNPEVNERSIVELNSYSLVREFIPIDLINIHVGSKSSGFEVHREIFLNNFPKLNPDIQSVLSLENDEKSYPFLEVLQISEDAGCRVVADFHHNRAYRRRKNDYLSSDVLQYDREIYDNIQRIEALYKNYPPTFHISSPRGGWCNNFKDECAHHDYIEYVDYPHDLVQLSEGKVFILDIEAKQKENALKDLADKLKI